MLVERTILKVWVSRSCWDTLFSQNKGLGGKVRSAQILTELVLLLIQLILKFAIGFIMTKKRLSNFQNLNSVNKFCEKRRKWKTLTLASLIFWKAQLYLSMKVCGPIIKCYGTNVRSSVERLIYTYFTSSGNIWYRIKENGNVHRVTHIMDFNKNFLTIDINDL